MVAVAHPVPLALRARSIHDFRPVAGLQSPRDLKLDPDRCGASEVDRQRCGDVIEAGSVATGHVVGTIMARSGHGLRPHLDRQSRRRSSSTSRSASRRMPRNVPRLSS